MMTASNHFAYLAETIDQKKQKNKKKNLKNKNNNHNSNKYELSTQLQRNIMSYKLLARQDEPLKC